MALLAVAVLALAGCGSHGSASAAGTTTYFAPGHRSAAPEFRDTLMTGATFDLAAQRGHVVVMNWWGSWCAPCRVEAADLESTYASGGTVFVGVNVQDQQDAAAAYEKAHGITYPSIFDPGGRIALRFTKVPPASIPSTIVIDPTGKIASIHLGAVTATILHDMISKAGS